MTNTKEIETPVGEVRGPWKTEPGNPFPYMAYFRSQNGWVPFHAKTGLAAIKDARDGAAKYLTAEKEKATQPLEWSPLWAAMDERPLEWIPTTEAMFTNMLEVLPPRATAPGRFLVGEPQRHNDAGQAVHACFNETSQGFFARYLTVAEFKQIGL